MKQYPGIVVKLWLIRRIVWKPSGVDVSLFQKRTVRLLARARRRQVSTQEKLRLMPLHYILPPGAFHRPILHTFRFLVSPGSRTPFDNTPFSVYLFFRPTTQLLTALNSYFSPPNPLFYQHTKQPSDSILVLQPIYFYSLARCIMSLSAKYQRFLANPSTAVLAEKASIHYITTLTTINEPTAIIKHLSAQAKQLEKKSEKLLSAIESSNGLCLDVETTLEFISGGGAFLPGLDDNFLADRTVTFPVVRFRRSLGSRGTI